jgi:hypothetical protein
MPTPASPVSLSKRRIEADPDRSRSRSKSSWLGAAEPDFGSAKAPAAGIEPALRD